MKSAHSQSVLETVRQLDAQLATGLTQAEVQRRLRDCGENVLPAAQKKPLWRFFLAQFQDFVVLLLIAAILISFLLGDTLEAVAILVIVLLNAGMGLIQEQRADAAMAALQKLSAPEAYVLRDGVHQQVPASELVPGDLVFLEAGNYVPADMQLIESANLWANEAALTGESDAVLKQAERVVMPAALVGDRVNMVFSGTLVTQGRGRGIVTATGLHTEMGLIARLMVSIEDAATPLQRRLNALGKQLSLVALGLCLLVFLVQLARNTDLGLITRGGIITYLQAESAAINAFFVLAVSLAVAAVPEGLAAIVTINLAIGMREMVKHHALIRRLSAVETLGSTTVICSDKTGTLTQNVMSVLQVYAGGQLFRVTGESDAPCGEFIDLASQQPVTVSDAGHPLLRRLLRGALLCSDAILEKQDGHANGQPSDRYRIVGDATEGALVWAAAKAGLWRDAVERQFPRMGEIAFDAGRKMMTTLHTVADADVHADSDVSTRVIFTKGAPDEVLRHCTAWLDREGRAQPMSPAQHEQLLAANAAMGQQALRVLAVATRSVHVLALDMQAACSADNLERDLTFLGLLGMMDPPRLEVPAAIQTAREAGIRTVMITGDYPLTAKAVAAQIGLLCDSNPAQILVGTEIEALDDDALAGRAKQASVFARVSPEHKVRIVSAMKRNGHIVAMTGDGINDAPALKRADIGIAMGITGTDVSKETADMVLTDDNFASIVRAVEQGRVVYANIRKFVMYLLSCNVAEVLILLLATLLGLQMPWTAIQLLWLNLITDGAPALALGLEKGEPDLMHLPPRPTHEPVINRRMRFHLLTRSALLIATVLGIYLLALAHFPAHASTIAFVTLGLAELPLAYISRTERTSILQVGLFSNPQMQWAVLLSCAGLLAAVYVPVLNSIFGTLPLLWAHWEWILPAVLVPALGAEIIKRLTYRQAA